jgi:hypothetical protein
VVPAVTQVPPPEQKAGGVNRLPLHEALPHWTEAEAWAQLPAPLQKPVLPQGGLGVQPAADVPAGRSTHMPPAPQA